MGWARDVSILAAALLVALPVHGADLDAMERAIRDASAERSSLVGERNRSMEEAAVQADEIARLKGGAGRPPRADRALEDALKRFDRLARQLDEVDRRIAGQDRTIATLRRKFDEAASAASAQLSRGTDAGSIGRVARELDAIEQARRRVASLGTAEPAFRPVLDVRPSADDGPMEMRQKLLLLESERDRVSSAIAGLDGDEDVLDARIAAKQRLSTELESAARTAGSELALLRREAEAVAESLRDLGVRREELSRHKASLSAVLAQVERRLEEFRAALRRLESPKGEVS